MNDKKVAALEELRSKTMSQIQFDTAITWATRAWAARVLANNAIGTATTVRWMLDAKEYEHEAIEHAALCGVEGAIDTVKGIVAGTIEP